MSQNIDLIPKIIFKTIEEVTNKENIRIDINSKIEDLEIIDDSLNSIIFFNTLEDNLKKELGENFFLEIEKIESTEQIETVSNLIDLVNEISLFE